MRICLDKKRTEERYVHKSEDPAILHKYRSYKNLAPF